MQIKIDMNTINKYIHAQEATVTKANPYIETDKLSTKAKSLLVKLVERGFYFKISTTTLNTLKEELVGELTSNNDVAVTTEDTPVNGDVSTNDSTTSTGTLTFAKTTDPIHGTVLFNSNGTYTYTPNSNFNGTDSFTYTVTDSVTLESLTKTVTITINEVSDLTVTAVIATVSEDAVLNSTVATNASTTSGNTLSFSKATDPVNGTVTISADGTFKYTPASNYNGTDTFDFITTDSVTGETQTKPVIITVTAIGDLEVQAYTNTMVQDIVLEGTLVGVATTTSGGVLEYSKATDPVNGAVVVNTNGTFRYTPTASYVGEDTFDFTVTDEDAGETRTETATITIETITPAPVVLPVTYNILKTGNTLVVAFSEPVKYNGLPLENYAGSSIDFIKNTSQPNQSLSLFDQALDETKVLLNTTAKSFSLRLEPNFFNKNIFKALDNSFVGGSDKWAGNEDGFYRIDFLFKPEAFTSLTDVVVPANTSDPTVDKLKITVYTTASETVTQHTAEDYENSDILGVFDNIPVYPTP